MNLWFYFLYVFIRFYVFMIFKVIHAIFIVSITTGAISEIHAGIIFSVIPQTVHLWRVVSLGSFDLNSCLFLTFRFVFIVFIISLPRKQSN